MVRARSRSTTRLTNPIRTGVRNCLAAAAALDPTQQCASFANIETTLARCKLPDGSMVDATMNSGKTRISFSPRVRDGFGPLVYVNQSGQSMAFEFQRIGDGLYRYWYPLKNITGGFHDQTISLYDLNQACNERRSSPLPPRLCSCASLVSFLLAYAQRCRLRARPTPTPTDRGAK